VVARTFPLAKAADAHRFLENDHPNGKVVLTAVSGRPATSSCPLRGVAALAGRHAGCQAEVRRAFAGPRLGLSLVGGQLLLIGGLLRLFFGSYCACCA